MPSQEDMKAALQAYIDGFNSGDPAAVVALFAADATVEDPVGNPPITGRDAIGEFYANAVASGAELRLDAPIRGSHGDAAAMAFTVEMPAMRIRVIDVMTFGEDGLITGMRAHWGPGDVETS
ncbi:nuclear transport factor 2 family protein [Actinomadura sp. WMMB 499]|uniref:nuclear transport factor 2 family protein n=1 Tax=Actinomadura sp. WMMB 499 TaxID=1219491 RepID=UPI0012463BAF|nr:nuclear transport factor 2 family protein [Actinomadura sp. WMMB 499]QFG20998.1 steroid delta-isomerase [Actinomadura sp. WMMB 499]